MKLIHGHGIKAALQALRPQRIAVAYVGKDWASYVDETHLEEIVLSPTLGSNPFAVQDIVEKIGWDNVHFLDNLHTKLYLGTNGAALGSFNMTANGLGAQGLQEAGCLIEGADHIADLGALFEVYRDQAAAAYPTQKAKERRLAELRKLWFKAMREGVVEDQGQDSTLANFVPYADDIYVSWVENFTVELNEDVVNPSIIEGSLGFHEDDPIETGKWVLCWPARKKCGYPNLSTNPYWLYIDEIYPLAAKDDFYTQLAVQRNDRAPLPEPFELSKPVIAALREVLGSEQFPDFRWSEDPWYLAPTLPQRAAFLEAVSQRL